MSDANCLGPQLGILIPVFDSLLFQLVIGRLNKNGKNIFSMPASAHSKLTHRMIQVPFSLDKWFKVLDFYKDYICIATCVSQSVLAMQQ